MRALVCVPGQWWESSSVHGGSLSASSSPEGCTPEISLAGTHGRLLTAARGPEPAWEGGPGVGEASEGPRFSDSCYLAAVSHQIPARDLRPGTCPSNGPRTAFPTVFQDDAVNCTPALTHQRCPRAPLGSTDGE